MKKTLILPMMILGVLVLALGGCVGAAGSGEAYTSEEIGLRKTNLLSDAGDTLKGVNYVATPAGESKNIERSFENAPPLIPHDVEGQMEITKDFNMCLSCHLPEVAKEANATAIPQTHFLTIFKKNHNAMGKQMSDARYNCVQCHVPQAAGVTQLVKNTFTPDYRAPSEMTSSNLIDRLNEGL
jgi:cytochrome c-type protein NapB